MITCGIAACNLFAAIWIHAVLYWLLIPEMDIRRNLYFDFTRKTESAVAFMDLTKLHEHWVSSNFTNDMTSASMLVPDVAYDVEVLLNLPTSSENRNIGMFTLTSEIMSANNVLATSVRPAMLPYRSILVEGAFTLVWLLPFITGISSESSLVHVTAFDQFIESSKHPITHVKFSLSEASLQLIGATAHFKAQLAGFRYLMRYWFCTTAFVVGGTIWVWLSFAEVWLYVKYCSPAARTAQPPRPNGVVWRMVGQEDRAQTHIGAFPESPLSGGRRAGNIMHSPGGVAFDSASEAKSPAPGPASTITGDTLGSASEAKSPTLEPARTITGEEVRSSTTESWGLRRRNGVVPSG